jgi:hypothetical protein
MALAHQVAGPTENSSRLAEFVLKLAAHIPALVVLFRGTEEQCLSGPGHKSGDVS